MKIDAISGFTMRSPLELTQTNPVGILRVTTSTERTNFFRELCKTVEIANVICYSSNETTLATMIGENVVFRTAKTKDLFTKVDEFCRFVNNSGFNSSALVIFEGLGWNTSDVNFQNDFLRLMSKCKFYNLRVLIDATNISDANFNSMLEAVTAHNIEPVNYKILCEGEEHLFTRVYSDAIVIELNDGVILLPTNVDFRKCDLMLDGARPPCPVRDLYTHYDVMSAYGDMTNRADGIIPSDPIVYRIYWDSSGKLDLQQLEQVLRVGRQHQCYSILIGDDVPIHLAVLCNTVK